MCTSPRATAIRSVSGLPPTSTIWARPCSSRWVNLSGMSGIIHWYNFRSMHSVLGNQVGRYKVQTPIYEGPLDLLLGLIERAELDITTISLAMVTDQYLDYIHGLEQADPEELSAFL